MDIKGYKEGWVPKNWCWRTLESPWRTRSSNQSILKEISREYSLEGVMLKLQNFNHLRPKVTHLRRPWCWERLKATGEGGSRGWDGWMASLTRWTWVWVNSGVGDGQGGLACYSSWGHKESDTTEQLNWTELNWKKRWKWLIAFSVARVRSWCSLSRELYGISYQRLFIYLNF